MPLVGGFAHPVQTLVCGFCHAAAGQVATRQQKLRGGIAGLGGLSTVCCQSGNLHGFFHLGFRPFFLGGEHGAEQKQENQGAAYHMLYCNFDKTLADFVEFYKCVDAGWRGALDRRGAKW